MTPVIAGSHGERINAFNIERHQINLVGPAGEIRHRIRLVPGSEHEHVRAGTAGQPVISGATVKGIVPLPAEQPVIAKAPGITSSPPPGPPYRVSLPAPPSMTLSRLVAGQDIVVCGAGEALHVRQRVGLRYTVRIGIGDVHQALEGIALSIATLGG